LKTFSILGSVTSRDEIQAEIHSRGVEAKTTAVIADEGDAGKLTHFDGFGEFGAFVEFKRCSLLLK
jgi:hypothetical protein